MRNVPRSHCWRAAPRCASCSRAWSIGSTFRPVRWCGPRIRSNTGAGFGSTRRSKVRATMASTVEGVSTDRVIIHTDGACSGNPGPGGWGAILQWNGHTREIKGGEPHTTNNRMELMAAIMALEALKRSCAAEVHTDSQYLRDGITKWIHGWKRNGWRTADKKPVKNAELWRRLDAALAQHKVTWHWVRGHAGHDLNERADELAR